MKNIIELKNIYPGKTIYVIGAGAQMNMINPSYFDDQITIGVNWVYQFYPIRYTMARHLCVIRKEPANVVYPDLTCDFDGIPSPDVQGWRFTDELRQAGSTSLTAIDLARYMGASRIVILGCEGYGGYFQGYPTGETNQNWLNKARWEMEQFVEYLERTEHIKIDWLRFVP